MEFATALVLKSGTSSYAAGELLVCGMWCSKIRRIVKVDIWGSVLFLDGCQNKKNEAGDEPCFMRGLKGSREF